MPRPKRDACRDLCVTDAKTHADKRSNRMQRATSYMLMHDCFMNFCVHAAHTFYVNKYFL